MIRACSSSDTTAMIELAKASGLFEPEQVDVLADTIAGHFSGESDEIWIGEFDGATLRGLAYGSPEVMTDRVWNLLFIAVHPDARGTGTGSTLVDAIEREFKQHGARMAIVETTNGDDFVAARGLYTKHGYEEEGTVRDYYADGQHKITFRKRLAPDT